MRVPLHEHFHVSVTSCQRAEVKRVLHCDAATSADMDALLSKKLPAAGIYVFQQIQIFPLLTSYDKIELITLYISRNFY